MRNGRRAAHSRRRAWHDAMRTALVVPQQDTGGSGGGTARSVKAEKAAKAQKAQKA